MSNITSYFTLLERMRRQRKRLATSDGLTNLDIEMQKQKRHRLISADTGKTLPPWYNVTVVEKVAIECAKYCVPFNEKSLLVSREVYADTIKKIDEQLTRVKEIAVVDKRTILPLNVDVFKNLTGEERKRYLHAYMHESICFYCIISGVANVYRLVCTRSLLQISHLKFIRAVIVAAKNQMISINKTTIDCFLYGLTMLVMCILNFRKSC